MGDVTPPGAIVPCRETETKPGARVVAFLHRDGRTEHFAVPNVCKCCGGENSVEVYDTLYNRWAGNEPLITTTCRKKGCAAYMATMTPRGHEQVFAADGYANQRG